MGRGPLVAGSGVEPLSPDAESDVLPLHHPAMMHRPAKANHMAGPCREKEKERSKKHTEEFIDEETQQNNGKENQKAIYIAEHLKHFLNARYEKIKLLSSDGTSHL